MIEAVRLTEDNLERVEAWCGGAIKGTRLPRDEQIIEVQTNHGEAQASIGDWIIRSPLGGYYPCDNDTFEMTYEPA